MKNFVQRGDVITATAPSGGAISGQPVLIDQLFGIAATTAAQGDPVELSVVGVFDIAKAVEVVGAGAPIFFDATAGVVTIDDDSRANLLIGVAVSGAAENAATARVRLNGMATLLAAPIV